MAIRYYLVPKVGTGIPVGVPGADPFRPKYTDGLSGPWSAMDYGREPVMLLRADVTPAEHAIFAAASDAVAAPADLSQTVGGALATVQARLESVNIPGDWVTAGMTFRTVLRWVARLFLLAQRLNGQAKERLFDALEHLDTLVNQVPAARRQRWAAAATSLGLDPSGITGGMTLRQAFKVLGDQIEIPIRFGQEVL
jgi:hypothetical protein